MKTHIPVVTLGIAVTSAWMQTSAQSPQATPFRARTDVVSVPVSVTKGREPVAGLIASDFEVTDNGARQVVQVTPLQDVPLDVTLVLTEFSPDREREFRSTLAGAGATRQLLRQADRLRLVLAENSVSGRLVGAGDDLAADPAIRALEPGRGISMPSVTFRGGSTTTASLPPGNDEMARTDPLRYGWGVALSDALFYALAWPVEADRRHAVIVFTDGFDTASTLDMETVPEIAARSDAVLHAVLWSTPQDGGSGGGLWTTAPQANRRLWERSYRLLDQSVQRTGGTLHRTRRAADALAEILSDFRSSYVLRFTPAQSPAPGWHDIKVTVKRPGVAVRARKGYEASSAVAR